MPSRWAPPSSIGAHPHAVGVLSARRYRVLQFRAILRASGDVAPSDPSVRVARDISVLRADELLAQAESIGA
jgi:hypothetical protein